MPETPAARAAKPTFYVTTPIYYVNDVPHIGHAYTTIIADTLARYKKMAGAEVFFLTGTDEHGQKIEKAAAEKGTTPKALADAVVGRAQGLWKALEIDYNFFIRTTMDFHEKGVQKLFARLLEKGDIYKGEYKGWYCVSDENFLAEDVSADAHGHKCCPDCGKKSVVVSEETYFFRLSAYQEKLLDLYAARPDFVRPASRMNEVESFVRGGLKDLSITRTTVKWGVPVPGDPAHTIYVWFDALHNYVTGIGYDWNMGQLEKFWPAVHLVGKDILRFHAIFWPAFLMAGGFEPPRCVFGHGWWLKDEAKMSKSKGNVLDPYVILDAVGPDPLRYFLMREIPIGLDGNFSHEGFLHRVNSDLANDLGNLVHRTLTMVRSYFGGKIDELGEVSEADDRIRTAFEEMKERALAHYEEFAINRALEEIWAYVSLVNKYLADNEPWKLAKDPARRGRLGRVLRQAAAAIRGVAVLVAPVMPGSAQKIWELLGEEGSIHKTRFAGFDFEALAPGATMKAPQPLFPRVDVKEFLAEEAAPQPKTTEGTMDYLSYEEFAKMDLRVAHVLKAERVEGAKKLLKLQIDVGTDKRQIVAGVAETYTPESLEGKKIIVIVNLKPAVIRGVESNGMLLAAVVADKAVIPFIEGDVPAGTKVK
ncbi:MAG: methionine--tRNA ligase [Candidatus Aminicenantes bacterium]|nr:methionine--tRNA ligase [Candidatus Aminicenantes bacterium]